MKATTTLDQVIITMRRHNQFNWRIYDPATKNLIDCYDGESLEESIAELHENVTNIVAPIFQVDLHEAPYGKGYVPEEGKPGRSFKNIKKFTLFVQNTNIPGQFNQATRQAPQGANITLDMYLSLFDRMNNLQLEMIKQQHEQALKEIQAKSKRTGSDVLIEKLLPVLISQANKPAQPVAGNTQTQPEQPVADPAPDKKVVNINRKESRDRAAIALSKLKQVDPDNFIQLLEKLGDYCENNPEQAKLLIGNL